jgi:hypothetical protein
MTENTFNPYDWTFERSSGYAGFRNQETADWIYFEDYERKFTIYQTKEQNSKVETK